MVCSQQPQNQLKQATVIGGQGFIGKALVSKLRDEGWQVWVPVKDDPQLFEIDLGKVFYCAGLTADYLQRPFDTVEAHASLINRLLYQARWQKLVYLSSTRLYDGLSGTVDETTSLVLNPSNARHLYDLSKLTGEAACLFTGKASVARLSCVYCDENDPDGFLGQLLQQVKRCRERELLVDSSAAFERDYVHLRDVVDALIAIMQSDTIGIFNVASGENVSNKQLFSLIAQHCQIAVTPAKKTTLTPAAQVSIDKISNELGWKPQPLLSAFEELLFRQEGN